MHRHQPAVLGTPQVRRSTRINLEAGRWGLEVGSSLSIQPQASWTGGFGLEPTIEMYVAHTVEILRECRRVLRSDGVIFWNIGDSYFATGTRKNNFSTFRPTYGTMGPMDSEKRAESDVERYQEPCDGLKPKDLCLIPARVALAAQADGWWVRSLIIWAKPNPMPESCRDRPTDAYEDIIMLTKSARYFFDAFAVREPQTIGSLERYKGGKLRCEGPKAANREGNPTTYAMGGILPGGRNLRNVWTFPAQPYKGAHFATFPEELPRRCILASTSERGACRQCGAPWERVTRDTPMEIRRTDRGELSGNRTATSGTMLAPPDSETIGWRPTCLCKGQRGRTVPCVVLDPFGGSGTTARVAVELNRRAVSVDLAYHDLSKKRLREVQRVLKLDAGD